MNAIFKISFLFFILSYRFLLSSDEFLKSTSDVWFYQVWEFEQWEHQAKHTRHYNEIGNILEHIIQIPDSKNNWVNKYKIVYSYNEKELQTEITTSVWNNDQWNYSTNLEIIYYDNDLIKERNFQLFKNDNWENDVQFAYEYSGSGKILLEIFSRWVDNFWEPYTKLIYYYDTLDLNYEILNIRFLDSVWVNYGRTLNFYDDNSLITKTSLFGWDISKEEWFYYEQNLFKYDNQKRLIEWINQQGDNDIWYNTFRETYEYTDFGKLYQQNKFRSVNYEWKNSIRITYFYDNNQDSIIILMEEVQNDEWINKERRIREDLLSDIFMKNNSNFSIFPNPTKNVLMILTEKESIPFGSYTIINMSGQVVQAGKLNYLTSSLFYISTDNFADGVYFLKLDNNISSKTIKFIKSR